MDIEVSVEALQRLHRAGAFDVWADSVKCAYQQGREDTEKEVGRIVESIKKAISKGGTQDVDRNLDDLRVFLAEYVCSRTDGGND